MLRSARPLAVAGMLSLLASGPAFAQSDSDKATARELGQTGQTALDAHDWKRAEDDFRRADALFHAPTLTLGLARAQAGQGRVVEAWESYHRIILDNNTSSPVFAKALADAQAEIGSVEGRRARVTINVQGADAPKVTIDDVPVRAEALGIERLVDPGQHVIKATADGYRLASQTITLAEGGTQTVTLTLQKDTGGVAGAPGAVVVAPLPPGTAAPPPEGTAPTETPSGGGSGMKTAAFVSFGVGGAGLLLGAITGGLAVSKHSTLSGECKGGTCPSSASSDLSSYHTMGTLSTVGFVVAGVGVAAGVTLILLAPKGTPSAPATGLRVTPFLGLGSAGAVGSF
jgi:hypothetical protein